MATALSPVENRFWVHALCGFMFLFMAFDHALHAYAQEWGRFWFFQDPGQRSLILDGFYMFDQAIIIPMIFFCVGMGVLPLMQQRSVGGFLKNRLLVLGVPFALGVPFIVPLLTYPRFVTLDDPNISVGTYMFHTFYERAQAGPFWVVAAILFFSVAVVLIHKLFPRFIPWCARQLENRGMIFLIAFVLLCFAVITVSDTYWGTPWWFRLAPEFTPATSPVTAFLQGFVSLFAFQGSRFGTQFLYFFLGAVFSQCTLPQRDNKDRPWSLMPLWLLLMLAVGVAYAYVCVAHRDWVFQTEPLRWRHNDLPLSVLWDDYVVTGLYKGPLLRTGLLSVLIALQALFLTSLFKRFVNEPSKLWLCVATCGYGIFLFHETAVVWLQYKLVGWEASPYVKAATVFVLGLSAGWLVAWAVRWMLTRWRGPQADELI
jgi:hypothetical protein